VTDVRLQLDEDCQDDALAVGLQQRGFDVKTANDLRLAGASDEQQLQFAANSSRILITNNIRDFGGAGTRSCWHNCVSTTAAIDR